MSTATERPPIRVALLGLGRAMFDEHYPVYRAHPELFKIVAACDLVKERRDRVANDYPACKMFRKVDDMLDEREIDLVDIATCSVDHVAHAVAALNKGVWVLLETPIALTAADTAMLKGAAMRAKNRLLVLQRGFFSPDYLLTRQMLGDPRLGRIYQVDITREDYVRRDDWQCLKRVGGGAAYYAMPDLMLKALRLASVPPVQMWGDLRRIASLGDAEDYAHVILRMRDATTVEITFNGGALPGFRSPAFVLRGENGVFRVEPGASEGTLTCIDPAYAFPRRRAAVSTPDLQDLHEQFPVLNETVTLDPKTPSGVFVFWQHVYETVRTAAPFPFSLDESTEAIRFSFLMKKSSPFGK